VKRWAQIKNGVVYTIVEQSTQPVTNESGSWVECSNFVSPDWLYNGSTFSPPPPPPVEE
jgi:hypothetical protein